MSHGFSDKAIRDTEPFILDSVKKFTDTVGESKFSDKQDGWSQKRNLGPHCTYLNFDVLGDLAFGKSFGCLVNDTNRWVPETIMKGSAFVYFVSFP
jgi:hypothetical protein